MTAVAEQPGEIVEQTRTLYERLLEVVKAVGIIEKDSRNAFHKYNYSSIEGVVEAVHGPLADQGILVLGGVTDITDVTRNTREGEAIVTTVQLTLSFVDVHTGERIDIPWCGRGDDPADKGVSKALTDARKTFLIQQLNLRRGDDTEADETTDQRHAANGTANLIADAKGLTNEQLNRVLVHIGLPAQQQPFGAFARIPDDKVEQAKSALAHLKAS
jgi:hypothetical protein